MLWESSSQPELGGNSLHSAPVLVLICTNVHLLELARLLKLGDGCSSGGQLRFETAEQTQLTQPIKLQAS